MTDINDLYRSWLTSAQDALSGLPRRCRVLLGFFAAQPPALVQALADHAGAGEFDELRVHSMHASNSRLTAAARSDGRDQATPVPYGRGRAGAGAAGH